MTQRIGESGDAGDRGSAQGKPGAPAREIAVMLAREDWEDAGGSRATAPMSSAQAPALAVPAMLDRRFSAALNDPDPLRSRDCGRASATDASGWSYRYRPNRSRHRSGRGRAPQPAA